MCISDLAVKITRVEAPPPTPTPPRAVASALLHAMPSSPAHRSPAKSSQGMTRSSEGHRPFAPDAGQPLAPLLRAMAHVAPPATSIQIPPWRVKVERGRRCAGGHLCWPLPPSATCTRPLLRRSSAPPPLAPPAPLL